MNEEKEKRIKEIQEEIHNLYKRYGEEDDEDIRRSMRQLWKGLVKEFEILSGYSPYRRIL